MLPVSAVVVLVKSGVLQNIRRVGVPLQSDVLYGPSWGFSRTYKYCTIFYLALLFH